MQVQVRGGVFLRVLWCAMLLALLGTSTSARADCGDWDCCFEILPPPPALPCTPTGTSEGCPASSGQLTGVYDCDITLDRQCESGIITEREAVNCGAAQYYECAGSGCFTIGPCCFNPHTCFSSSSTPVGSGCNPGLPDCDDEICGNGFDDDCDGTTDESTTGGGCTDEEGCNERDDDGDGQPDEDSTMGECCAAGCGRCEGQPVDLYSRQMYVGPHTVARVASDLGGSADLHLSLIYDSSRAKRDHDDDTTGPGGATPRRQQPYLRDSGPGFRHSYSDRLVFARGAVSDPVVMRWESALRSVRFYKTSTAGTFISEPGTNHRLRRSGTTWRIHTDGGDVLEFNEMSGSGTWLHPWDAALGFHARLSAIHPGGAAMRKTVLLYEDSPQGTAPTQLPAAACTGLATANSGEPAPANSGCDIGRGLLVKVGVVLDGTLHGTSLEMQYRYVDDAGQRDQYLIKAVRSGADRINLTTISTLAELTYLGATSVSPKRLERVRNTLYCTSTNDSCLRWKYSYTSGAWPWAITDVDQTAVSATGVRTDVEDEDFTWDGTNPVITSHKSRGKSLQTSTAPGTSTMAWTRNGQSETTTFDVEGRPVQCSAGTCGDPSSEKTYQFSSTPAFDDVALGISRDLGEDGIWTFRRFSEQGLVEFLCSVAPDVGAIPTCTFSDGDATNGSSVVVTGGRMRSLERRYYDVNGRLHVRAVYDPDTTLAGSASAPFKFPHPADATINWFFVGSTSVCPTLTPSRTFSPNVHRYAITVYTVNSDGNATLNELGTTDFSTKPDALVVRVNNSTQTTTSTATKSECTLFQRNARGDITSTRRFFDGTERDETHVEYLTLADAHALGRKQSVQLMTTLGTKVNAVTPFVACASAPYDDEGTLKCFDQPYANGNVNVLMTFTPGDGAYAFKRLTTMTFGADSYFTFAKVLGSGLVHEDGIGNPGTTGVCGVFGSARLRVFKSDGDAAQDGTLATWSRLDSTCAALETRTFTVNAFGQITLSETRDRLNVLRSKEARVPDVDDLTMQTTAGDATLSAVTSYAREPWGALLSTIEPDGHVVEYVHGTTLDQAARLEEVRRGPAQGSTTAVQKRLYTRDGLIKELQSPGESNAPIAQLTYDGLRRLTKETRNGAGQTVEFTYRDRRQLASRIVKGTDGVTKENVTMTYDAMGRVLQEKNTRVLRARVYDTKGSFAGLPGTPFTNNFQAGRLAYEEDPAGATFYEYDFAGRVVAVVRHDGALTAFNAANLTTTSFAYANTVSGNAGQLTTMTYPSGRVVTYGYMGDKGRPDSISTTGLGTLISQTSFEPSGAIKELYFGPVASLNLRRLTHDILGRVSRIEDRYANTAWSDVNYQYDLDGDVIVENDASAQYTWLAAAAFIGNQTRNYGYLANKDILSSWKDDSTPEAITAFAGEARRVTEVDGSQSFTYSPGVPVGVFNNLERVEKKEITTAASVREVDPTYDSAGRWVTADWPIGGTVELSFAYGQLGNTTSITLSSTGTYTLSYDAQLRPSKIIEPSGAQRRFLYGFGRAPLQERFISAGVTTTAETIYLAGAPVAQIVSSGATTNLYNLHTDRMGMVRKIAQPNGARVRRIVTDAWGAANGAFGDVSNDMTIATAPPFTNWRYPGQFAFSLDLRLNGWRVFVPEIGQYTSPDPLHVRGATSHYGPQAFSYSAGRPLKYTDPDGRCLGPSLPACIVLAEAIVPAISLEGAAAWGLAGGIGLGCAVTGLCDSGGGSAGEEEAPINPDEDVGDWDEETPTDVIWPAPPPPPGQPPGGPPDMCSVGGGNWCREQYEADLQSAESFSSSAQRAAWRRRAQEKYRQCLLTGSYDGRSE